MAEKRGKQKYCPLNEWFDQFMVYPCVEDCNYGIIEAISVEGALLMRRTKKLLLRVWNSLNHVFIEEELNFRTLALHLTRDPEESLKPYERLISITLFREEMSALGLGFDECEHETLQCPESADLFRFATPILSNRHVCDDLLIDRSPYRTSPRVVFSPKFYGPRSRQECVMVEADSGYGSTYSLRYCPVWFGKDLSFPRLIYGDRDSSEKDMWFLKNYKILGVGYLPIDPGDRVLDCVRLRWHSVHRDGEYGAMMAFRMVWFDYILETDARMFGAITAQVRIFRIE